MTNFVQLMARFDPHYQLKLQQIQQSAYNEQYRAYANMERERFKANEEWQRMQYKASEDWRQTQYKAEQENQRMQTMLAREDQREEIRGKNALAVEEARGQNALNLATHEHQSKLAQMQADLEHRLTIAGFESGILATQKIMDEDNNRRASLLKQIEERSQLRGEVTKMLMGAIIQEKLAQKQHKRDLEKMSHESDLKQAEMYFSSLCGYLWKLLDASKEQEAKAEIDRLHEVWRAGV